MAGSHDRMDGSVQASGQRQPLKVLIAEDSRITRRLLEVALTERGHSVVGVGDGEAAWTEFERLRPQLVVLDWQMPLLDGLEVCRRIRASAASRDTFVLMVTARDAAEDLAAAMDAGADDYITKPIEAVPFRARITIAERRIELNAARWAAEDQLAQARWLAGIGETTLALQHEINNPLTALLGTAELAAADPLTTPEMRAELITIRDQARRIAAVVRKLSTLQEPRTVEYIRGARMLDLSVTPWGAR